MVRRLFERRQHQCGISRFLYTESRDTEYFTLLWFRVSRLIRQDRGFVAIAYLVRHGIAEKTNMSRIDIHTVRLHRCLNLGEDGMSRSFDTQDFLRFHDVIRPRLGTDDTCGVSVNYKPLEMMSMSYPQCSSLPSDRNLLRAAAV